jgi:hypothetical protein
VDEYIAGAVVGLDKTITFGLVKPSDASCCHSLKNLSLNL